MTEALTVHDGTERVLEDRHEGTLYLLPVMLRGHVTAATSEALGPALSRLYGQTLVALLADRQLGGLVADVTEGGESDPEGDDGAAGLEIDLMREAYTAPAAGFGLHALARYFVPAGAVAQREAILDAIASALNANVPLPLPTVRERVLVALRAHVEAALGMPMRRNADRPVDEPAVVMLEGDQSPYHDTLGLTFYRAAVAFEVFTHGGSTAGLDATVQWIRGALRSAAPLGGLITDVELGSTDPETLRQEYSGPLLAARVECFVWYATPEGDPTAVAS